MLRYAVSALISSTCTFNVIFLFSAAWGSWRIPLKRATHSYTPNTVWINTPSFNTLFSSDMTQYHSHSSKTNNAAKQTRTICLHQKKSRLRLRYDRVDVYHKLWCDKKYLGHDYIQAWLKATLPPEAPELPDLTKQNVFALDWSGVFCSSNTCMKLNYILWLCRNYACISMPLWYVLWQQVFRSLQFSALLVASKFRQTQNHPHYIKDSMNM